MRLFRGAYLNGKFRKASSRSDIWVKRDPGNIEMEIGTWQPTAEWEDAAVLAAQKAFKGWAGERSAKRYSFLRRLQKIYRKRKKELAEIISKEMGKPLAESLAEVQAAITKVDITLGKGLALIASTHGKNTPQYYQFMPRGVLAVLGPYNFPLHLPNGHLIPALAVGNTVIFKPSELTPFTGQFLAECFHEAGFPKGVFNMVQGGGEVGSRLAAHEGIQGVLFVGSDTTGKKIQKTMLGQFHKILVLEMGGKNAAVIFPDADFSVTLEYCLKSWLTTTGQRCTSLSRLILHDSLVGRFLPKLVEAASRWRFGYYRDSTSQAGPLVSQTALQSFLNDQHKADRETKPILRAKRIRDDLSGYYVGPSLHRVLDSTPAPQKTGYRYDEIFGPDLAVYTFKNLEEAVRIHNDCRFGLVATVFTRKRSLFHEILKYLEVGNIYCNRPTIGAPSSLPFGGIKASGNHFPAGLFSPYYCTYPLSIQE